MCGIFGVCSFNRQLNVNQFEKSLEFIKHRGPDYAGIKQVDDHVIFGHTRLSIIDLSSANHQPFSVDDRYALTYNGEVYNYLEIKEELLSKGIQFKTSGDTEVLLQSYITWGEECVKKFNGMWAFAIYDKKLKKLFCSRDRFGVKPFVYYLSATEFIFSSEIKPIIHYKPGIKEPDYNMIANFCYKSIGAQAEQTWFKNILRLLPAHNLVVEGGKAKIYRYWDYPKKINKTLTFDKAKKEFTNLFNDAIKLRMRSDVRVGSTLSSGLDSSSIVGVINKEFSTEIETFTAYNANHTYTKKDKEVFKGNVDLDESNTVKELVKDFNVVPNFIEVSYDKYLQKLSESIYYLESGHSSPATISIHQVYKCASKKVKVLLEGQGADELLAGYILDNIPVYLIELIRSFKFTKAIKEFNFFRKIYSTRYLLLQYLRSFDNSFLNWLKNRMWGIDFIDHKAVEFRYIKDNKRRVSFDEDLTYQLYKQHTSGLVNLLHYGDALSMAEGIECRLPFMDYRLVEYCFQLPYDFKINESKGKYIQRKAMEKYVPNYISNSALKIGFVTPLDDLFRNSREIEDVLLNQRCGPLFDEDKVKRILNEHRQGRINRATLLYRILSAKIWYRTFFN